MQLHLLTDEPGIAISYDAANQWLYADWRGEHDQESSQAGCLALLAALQRYPCRKLLNDNSGVVRQRMRLSAWGAWWLGEMRTAGLEYVAWVFPPEFEARYQTEQTIRFIEDPVVVAFDDLASACQWLQLRA